MSPDDSAPNEGGREWGELADEPAEWPVTASRDLHRDDWIVALREDTVERPGHPGQGFSRVVLEHPGAVVVLAVDEDERVLCLKQYRHANQARFVEIPAGLRDAGDEPPEDTARRELREEAELEARDWTLLASVFPSAGITSERQFIYLARGLSPCDRGDFELKHEEAEMTASWVPMADLLDAVLAGKVRESPLVVAVLAYDALARRGDQ